MKTDAVCGPSQDQTIQQPMRKQEDQQQMYANFDYKKNRDCSFFFCKVTWAFTCFWLLLNAFAG